MSEIELNNTRNLLNHVNLIKKKYDDLAEYTGENYNVFNVLGIYSDELSHSAIIGNLLNAKGKHGQKDVFLKLFLEEISGFEDESEQKKVLDSFDKLLSQVFIEKHIGKVNHENGEGGRIDILINDGKSNIIIENKVWAGDQHQQLVRYYNEDNNAPILYLTLDGKEPSKASINSEDEVNKLTLGKEFVCISYQTNIVNWLEKCIKEMANKPIIRESLNQYLVLVKQLTNQSTNNKMKNEIIDLISNNENNINSAKIIFENYQNVINSLIKIQVEEMINVFTENGINKDSISISRSVRLDGFFIVLKSFELKDGFFDLGITIELLNNHFFFCVVRKDDIRKSNVNTNSKFNLIKEYLHSRIDNLKTVNGFTIGKANNFTIGINTANFYLKSIDNKEIYKELALKIVDFKKSLDK